VKGSWSTPKPTNTWSGSIPETPPSALTEVEASGQDCIKNYESAAGCYGCRELSFKFRGREYGFTLSHGLFSSADIDRGSRLLLKVLSRLWDQDIREGRPLPRAVLDAGSGVGVIGICAAGALGDLAVRDLCLRAQDRDELARCFTEENARRNRIPPSVLEAYTEPLLAGPPEARWDLILSNIPAKAGAPVLRDFVGRGASLLTGDGRLLLVAVKPLAEAFRSWIAQARCPLLLAEEGPGHTVFACGPPAESAGAPGSHGCGPIAAEADLLAEYPAYVRGRGDYTLEGISYSLEAGQGAADFDSPSIAVKTAAALASRLRLPERLRSPAGPPPLLVHEPDQGHFPVWLASLLRALNEDASWVFSGRNILALGAARHNFLVHGGKGPPRIVPVVDLGEASLAAAGPFGLIAAFPELVPGVGRAAASWAAARRLLLPGGILLVSLPALQAADFDRVKPPGFTRLRDLKRRGHRALAYIRQ
jgi:hypothetical protein